MIKQKKNFFKDGSFKTNVRVMISYRPGPNMKPKQKTIKNFGYLEDYEDQTAFWDEVNRTNDNALKGHDKDLLIVVPKRNKNNDNFNIEYNYGYYYLESIFKMLELDKFFDGIDSKCKYSLYDIFSFLVYQRLLNPSSKRMTMRQIDKFYNKNYDFELHDIYRSLDQFSDCSVQLQAHINDKIKKIIGRDQSYAFYDVTNYYFEKDFNGPKGTYPQKGVSKEHQLTPIVQFGLFMDSNNIPVAMKAYPGNTSDSITLQPSLLDIKKDFNLGRLIVVADKGMNSSSNIDFIVNNGDGYVVSQTLKGYKGKRYQEVLFDEEGYIGDDDFRYKIFEEEYESSINSKKKTIRKRKVLIYWSKEDARFAKAKRQEKILKAEKSLQNNAYSTSHANFVNNGLVTQYFVKKTGEQADSSVKSVDYDRFEEDEKYDGYFCIITSELDYDYKKILEVYHHLAYIEESFRITKSDLETRPIYVTKDSHIDGHLLVCFVSLILLRLIQYKMGKDKISAERIKKILNRCTCSKINDMVIHLNIVNGEYDYEKQIIDDCKNSKLKLNKNEDQIRNDYIMLCNKFNVNFDYSYLKVNEFNKELKNIKYNIK